MNDLKIRDTEYELWSVQQGINRLAELSGDTSEFATIIKRIMEHCDIRISEKSVDEELKRAEAELKVLV